MLNAIRRLASTWVGKIIGALLVIAMATFGLPTILQTLNTNSILKVGGEDITITDFQRRVVETYGRNLTGQEMQQEGGKVLSTLMIESAVGQYTNSLGLGASDAQLAFMLREDQRFNGLVGKFDRDVFASYLRQMGYTENQYYDQLRRTARANQLETALTAGVPVPTTTSEIVRHYQTDTRTIEYFILNGANAPAVPAPTEAELAAYLTDHQATYRTKETRATDILLLTLDSLAEQYPPTEEEISAEYESTKDQLVRIETRDVKQITLPDDEKVAFFEQQQAAGVDFDTAAAASGLQVNDFGTVTKAGLIDTILADAAFSIGKAGDFVIIPGIGGKRVVGVTSIVPGGQISFEDAKADIAKRLALATAREHYIETQDQIEELRAGLRPLKEIAERLKLKVTSLILTNDGDGLKDVQGLPEADYPRVIVPVFAAEPGKLTPSVALGTEGNVWFEVGTIEPARDQTLDEVRDAVVAAWTAQKTTEAIEADAASAVADLEQRTSIQIVAYQHNAEAKTSEPFTRFGKSEGDIDITLAGKIFGVGPTAAGWALNGKGDHVVYHIIDAAPSNDPIAADTLAALKNGTAAAIFQAVRQGILSETGTGAINQTALATAFGLDTTAQQ